MTTRNNTSNIIIFFTLIICCKFLRLFVVVAGGGVLAAIDDVAAAVVCLFVCSFVHLPRRKNQHCPFRSSRLQFQTRLTSYQAFPGIWLGNK